MLASRLNRALITRNEEFQKHHTHLLIALKKNNFFSSSSFLVSVSETPQSSRTLYYNAAAFRFALFFQIHI